MKFNPNVFVNASVSLCVGILLSKSYFLCLLLALLPILFVCFRNRYALINGFIVSTLSLLLGISLVWVKEKNQSEANSFDLLKEQKGFYAIVIASPKQKNNWQQTLLEIRRTNENQARTKIQAFFPKESSLKFGDLVFVKGAPIRFQPPSLPMGFDYKAYLERKGITHRSYIKHYQIVGHEKKPLLAYYANLVRLYCETQFKTYVRSPQSGLLIAMVLGQKDDLDSDLRTAYQATGTMHVLAVSGLHVGILFFVISFFLLPLRKIKGGTYLYVGISMALLWFYAAITGFSPSVMRASTMISVTTFALVFGRKSLILNTIGFAAFFLVVLDHKTIYDVGFQYSFSAVLGIVLLYNPLYSIWSPENKITDYFWQLFCVSLAAQLATSPLSLYYFHKFPTYFFIANVFVVPLASFVLSGGLLLLLVSWLPLLAVWVGKLCELIVFLMNSIVLSVEKLPFSVMSGFFPTIPMVVVQYLLIATAFLFFLHRKSYYFTAVLIFLLIHSGLELYHDTVKKQTSQMVVGDFRPASGLIAVDKGKSLTLIDSMLSPETKEYKLGNFLEYFPEKPIAASHSSLGLNRWICFKGKKIWHVSSKPNKYPLFADYIVIGRNSIKNLDIFKSLQCRQIILDPTNGIFYCKNIKQQAQNLGIAVHSVREDGLWQLGL